MLNDFQFYAWRCDQSWLQAAERGDMTMSVATSMIGSMAPRGRAQDIDRHVGARLRERRLLLGLTQQELAALIEVTCQQAHKYEKGINRIAAGRLSSLAQALGVGRLFLRRADLDTWGRQGHPAARPDARASAQLHGPLGPPATGGGLHPRPMPGQP